jgi:hypothetical protein
VTAAAAAVVAVAAGLVVDRERSEDIRGDGARDAGCNYESSHDVIRH